ncbi:stage V sporulation protein AE [Alkaliphilus sp. MSJ-5]|uniref:Stage V sporulation protein AE n=1 Tax=Alkaliphilus flagellatus TaxID=2841507 RepID=A0ABS6G670_9FIRM|nr:stage V sporulation protein AE [Alkaliphilus flagellatus]MBU5677659.1 stage V sporulation protein AE [Alkaliphilus flagellatus]
MNNTNTEKRKIILVTDGDSCAQKTLEIAVSNIGGRCISRSGGNPTPITSSEIVELVKQAKNDPVVVMVDDRGNTGIGKGEQAMFEIINHPEIEVLGIVAVASNTKGVRGVRVDYSIDNNGNMINAPVDKHGNISDKKVLYGDTVDIINNCNVPIVIGVGDIGKMEGKDVSEIGAPIITKALEEIITRNSTQNKKGYRH